MEQDRDMYYGGYGMPPGTMNQPMMPGMMPNMESSMNQTMMPGMMPSKPYMGHSDMESRIIKLEQQMKRLDFRVSRLETPYGSNSGAKMNIHNEPDSNMYVL